jgi:hypothetical protein
MYIDENLLKQAAEKVAIGGLLKGVKSLSKAVGNAAPAATTAIKAAPNPYKAPAPMPKTAPAAKPSPLAGRPMENISHVRRNSDGGHSATVKPFDPATSKVVPLDRKMVSYDDPNRTGVILHSPDSLATTAVERMNSAGTEAGLGAAGGGAAAYAGGFAANEAGLIPQGPLSRVMHPWWYDLLYQQQNPEKYQRELTRDRKAIRGR